MGDYRYQTTRYQNLERSKPQHQAFHLPKTGWVNFYPDDEQQEHHTQFGQMRYLVEILDVPKP